MQDEHGKVSFRRLLPKKEVETPMWAYIAMFSDIGSWGA